ncbi:riboflavin synthase [Bacillus rubiinfantis]|uniref:riboflavin synthase n=1 Tax=Bacillus rubiinfantis TaxID=1499680 RepID=UPI0005AB8CBE|nr:riboflavin synthase [Bacillus rubiinfantis]
MFTGIVEELGTVVVLKRSGASFVLTIEADKILSDVQLGDSIAVNGVCLTVTAFTSRQFTVDVMPETVKATSLQTLSRGSKVNLERAMAAGGRFGGHFVTGHIDGTGIIKQRKREENAVYYEIETGPDLMRYIILKGSIAVDGTSLTVFARSEQGFMLSLIPHTLKESVLGLKGPGDIVNLECDMIGKYIDQLLNGTQRALAKSLAGGISAQFLQENGFS